MLFYSRIVNFLFLLLLPASLFDRLSSSTHAFAFTFTSSLSSSSTDNKMMMKMTGSRKTMMNFNAKQMSRKSSLVSSMSFLSLSSLSSFSSSTSLRSKDSNDDDSSQDRITQRRDNFNSNSSNSHNNKNNQLLVQSLLQSSINRATRTISDLSSSTADATSTTSNDSNTNGNDDILDVEVLDESNIPSSSFSNNEGEIQNLLENVINRSSNVVGMEEGTSTSTSSAGTERSQLSPEGGKKKKQPHQDKRQYLSNPSVTPTALAHSLWSQVIQPYTDTIIDATCGNGKDTLVLANLLFPNEKDEEDKSRTSSTSNANHHHQSQLIGIDIQKQACENTVQLLKDNLPLHIVENNIQIFHSSHAPLPKPQSSSSVGLICYNLGYLPGSGSSNKHVSTKMITTIYSLADAALLLRVGGLLSVMAYPGSSYLEYCAVKYFVEGLAMFTSRDDWREYVDCIPNDHLLLQGNKRKMVDNGDDDDNEDMIHQSSVRESVRVALERVMSEGNRKQTWRAFDHRPLGRPMSPILFTAMRIK